MQTKILIYSIGDRLIVGRERGLTACRRRAPQPGGGDDCEEQVPYHSAQMRPRHALIDTITIPRIARDPVFIDMLAKGLSTNVININRAKSLDLVEASEFVHTCVHGAWSNLPDPPTNEKTLLFMWMVAAEGYCLNTNQLVGAEQ
ncbi:hypothetical protein F4782DRAFT_531271 [Xylaria castorea]|nr:hypothetical protein F4782DRAFT_531271 [Xylaria castorea]